MRRPAEPLRLDALIRAGAIHSMAGETFRAVGITGPTIASVATDPDALDDLIGSATVIVDVPELTLLPAFSDSHEHLMEASRNTLLVPVDRATSIGGFLELVRQAAKHAAPGAWVLTSMGWHESNLAENRLPTIGELDGVAPANPVLARRGGHLAIANTQALSAAGIGAGTANPPGGGLGHDEAGQLTGVLEGAAVYVVAGHAPPVATGELVDGLQRGSAAYAALGVGTIREAMINLDELQAYQRAAEQGLLNVRVRPMIRVGAELTADAAITLIRGLGLRSGFGDDRLRIWGLKLVMDGGVEGGAMTAPYANDASNSGHLNWEPGALTAVCVEAVRNGLRVGTHAVGDRAVATVLDAYEAVLQQVGPQPAWTLVVEHALVTTPEERSRAVSNNIGITVQHALLWNMGSEMLDSWGAERTRDISPLDAWVAAGADLAAGTDMARPINPMINVWGMVTRGTRAAGVQGADHAVPVATALELYTMGSARLNHEQDHAGSIEPGKFADLVAYSKDPMTAAAEDLQSLVPIFTIVGGRAVHDPDGHFGR